MSKLLSINWVSGFKFHIFKNLPDLPQGFAIFRF